MSLVFVFIQPVQVFWLEHLINLCLRLLSVCIFLYPFCWLFWICFCRSFFLLFFCSFPVIWWQIWMKIFLGSRVFYVVGFLFHHFKCIVPLSSSLQFLQRNHLITLWGFLCMLLVAFLLLLLIFFLCLYFLSIWLLCVSACIEDPVCAL